MSAPSLRHTPYDGSRRPFSIGLAPVDPMRWIEPDGERDAELAEKDRLIAERPEIVIYAEPETTAAQLEIRDMVTRFLEQLDSGQYRRAADGFHVGERFVPFDTGEPALVTASRLVQDDLCIMRRDGANWRLVAACVCFPSSWTLAEMGGKPLDFLHARVPGYAGAMGQRMARIFDNLPQDQTVVRLNWSIYDDGDLHHPFSKGDRSYFAGAGGQFGEKAFLRVERQSLRRLPGSGDILFAIKVHVDPMQAFRSHPEGAQLALSLRDQIAGLNADQLAYKGMTLHRDKLIAALSGLAAEIGGAGD